MTAEINLAKPLIPWKKLLPVLFVVLAALGIFCDCSRPAASVKSDKFFTEWLQGHGETNLVTDADGVGIVGNPTRLSCSLYGSEAFTNGSFTAELEFCVKLPDGRKIVDYVAGSGNSLKQAEDDAKLNFIVSTFHVVYRSFLNPQDPHQTEEKITINGQPRVLVLGDTMTRSQTTNDSPNMFPFRDQFRTILAAQPLSPETHWIKIIYANHHAKSMMCAVTMDNNDSPALTEAVKNLPWPTPENFYMAKQFIVVK